MALFEDNLMHAFDSEEDRVPVCGEPVAYKSPGSEEDYVCDKCSSLLMSWIAGPVATH